MAEAVAAHYSLGWEDIFQMTHDLCSIQNQFKTLFYLNPCMLQGR